MAPTTARSSRLFCPYRAIGSISDGAPFAINRLGDATFITTTVGNAFQVFESDKLRLSIVAPPLIEGGRVISIAAQAARTFVATERQVQVWERVTLKESLSPPIQGRIVSMLLLGDVILALTNEAKLVMWNTKSLEHVGKMEIEGGDFSAGGVLIHPDTYLNKILIGDSAGQLSLWNIRSRKLVHRFQLSQQHSEGPTSSAAAITALEGSPAIDVVAIGRSDGTISIVNLRYDRILFTLRQDNAGVTSLAFRTDTGSEELPMLVSGGQDGQIYVWDLKTQKLHSMIRAAHDAPVSRVYFFPREPLLLSCSRDNSLKMWVFDGSDGSARLLKSREGHTAPPRRIRYYGDITEASMGTGADATGCQILSAGSDRALRVFNTARDAQSREMSQGPLLKKAKKMHVRPEDLKLRPILGFAAAETRARDWCNVITCHEGDCNAYVWNFDQRAIGKAVLRQPDWEGNEMMTPEVPERQALCVAVSSCGNYGLVGTRGGVVYIYNMQSGAPRGAFPKTKASHSKPHESLLLEKSKKARPGSVWAAYDSVMGNSATKAVTQNGGTSSLVSKKKVALGEGHEGPVTGVEVDSLNRVVVSSSLDGTLRFWDFKTHALLEVIHVGVGIAQLEQARDSELLAASCDDFVVRVYDVATRKLVRRLAGHTTHISEICFSRDGRRLVTASVDATVRVWDLPTGACVDWLKFKRPVTGVAMSHTGEFLCTSHVDRLGLYLWADRSFYQNVTLEGQLSQPYEVDEPVPLAEVADSQPTPLLEAPTEPGPATLAAATSQVAEEEEEKEKEKRQGIDIEPKKEGMITLAMLPRAHWQTLFQLELIKQRNKPIEPPKAPPRAPFFLPTLHPDGVNPVFAPPPPPSASAAAGGEGGGGDAMEEEGIGMTQAWSDDDDEEENEDDQGMKAATGNRPLSSALNSAILPTGSRILKQKKGSEEAGRPSRSKLGKLVKEAETHEGGDEVVLKHLVSLAPPQVDLEMQALCLGSFDEDGVELLGHLMRYLTRALQSRRHFEAIQAYLNRFLKIYSPILLEVSSSSAASSTAAHASSLRQGIQALRTAQAEANRAMKDLVQHNLCLLGFFTNLKGI